MTPPRLLLVVLGASMAVVVGLTVRATVEAGTPRPVVAPASSGEGATARAAATQGPVRTRPPGPPARAARVLRRWDQARAAAWAAGDDAVLQGLYTRRSRAGRHDRAMLRAWQRRGLVVRGWQTRVVRLGVVAHTPRRWVLRVVDQVVGGRAHGRGIDRALPRDRPTTRRVVLRRVAGRWLVASVRAAGP